VQCLDALAPACQRAHRREELLGALLAPDTIGEADVFDARLWLLAAIQEDGEAGERDFPPLTVMPLPPSLAVTKQPHLFSLDSLLASAPVLPPSSPYDTVTGVEISSLSSRVPQLVLSVMRRMGPRVGAVRVPAEEAMAALERESSLCLPEGPLALHLLPARPRAASSGLARGAAAGRSGGPVIDRAHSIAELLGVSPAELKAYRRVSRPTLRQLRARRSRQPTALRPGCRHTLLASMAPGLPPLGRWPPAVQAHPTHHLITPDALRSGGDGFGDMETDQPRARRRASEVLSRLNDVQHLPLPERRSSPLPVGGGAVARDRPAAPFDQAAPASPGLDARAGRPLHGAASPITTPRGVGGPQSLGSRRMGLRAAVCTSSRQGSAHEISTLDETIEESVAAYFKVRRAGAATAGLAAATSAPAPTGAAVSAAAPPASAEPLVSKLERTARRGGLLAVLPASVAMSLPMLAAQLLHALVPSEHASALWLLPGDAIPAAMEFWSGLGETSLHLRALSGPPGDGVEPLLERGQIGIFGLADVATALFSHAGGATGAPAACTVPLVVLTLTPPDLAGCTAVGAFVSGGAAARPVTDAPQLLALVCGLPDEADPLLSMCRELCVPHLHIRTEADADVDALARQYRVHGYRFPDELGRTCAELWQLCRALLTEAQQQAGHLSRLPLTTTALTEAIEAYPRGGDAGAFQRLMACHCARQALDHIGWTDAAGLRSHLDTCARSLKRASACRSHPPLAALLSRREEVQAAVADVGTAKRAALRTALQSALADGFGGSNQRAHGVDAAPVLSTTAGKDGDAAHGVVVFAHQRLLPSVREACQAILSPDAGSAASAGAAAGEALLPTSAGVGDHVAGAGVQIVAVDVAMEPQHVLNLLQRARQLSGGGGAKSMLLLLMTHEKLLSFGRFPWKAFRLYIELDAPGAPFYAAAQLQQPTLAVHVLQPQSGEEQEQEAANEAWIRGRNAEADFEASLMEPLDRRADRGGAARAGAEDATPEGALREAARLVRAAYGGRYDEAIHLGALVRKPPPQQTAQGQREEVVLRVSEARGAEAAAGAGHGRQAVSWPLMVGEAMLDAPKLLALLRKKGVQLIETSAQLPHLFLGADAGLLACDEVALRNPSAVAEAVRLCEQISLRSLWILVLLDDEPVGTTADERRGRSSDGAQSSSGEFAMWRQVNAVLAMTSGSPIRLCVRLSPWRNAWHSLQHILLSHQPEVSEWVYARNATSDETEHERLLLACGLSPWAARKVCQEYTLRSFLALPKQLRAKHFAWLPERALRRIAALHDDDEDGAGGGGRRAFVPAHDEHHHYQHAEEMDVVLHNAFASGEAAGDGSHTRVSGGASGAYKEAATVGRGSGGQSGAARAQEQQQHLHDLGYAGDAATVWQAAHPCWHATDEQPQQQLQRQPDYVDARAERPQPSQRQGARAEAERSEASQRQAQWHDARAAPPLPPQAQPHAQQLQRRDERPWSSQQHETRPVPTPQPRQQAVRAERPQPPQRQHGSSVARSERQQPQAPHVRAAPPQQRQPQQLQRQDARQPQQLQRQDARAERLQPPQRQQSLAGAGGTKRCFAGDMSERPRFAGGRQMPSAEEVARRYAEVAREESNAQKRRGGSSGGGGGARAGAAYRGHLAHEVDMDEEAELRWLEGG